MVEDKGAGRGRGRYTAAGAQAQQATDIEGLKAAFAQHIADHEAAEDEGGVTPTPPEDGGETPETPTA